MPGQGKMARECSVLRTGGGHTSVCVRSCLVPALLPFVGPDCPSLSLCPCPPDPNTGSKSQKSVPDMPAEKERGTSGAAEPNKEMVNPGMPLLAQQGQGDRHCLEELVRAGLPTAASWQRDGAEL